MDSQHRSPIPPSIKRDAIAHLLEQRSLSIVESLNNRDIPTPFLRFASHDYTYHHPLPNGEVLIRDSLETQTFLKWLMTEQNSLTLVEVVSMATQMNDDMDHATAWVSLMAHKDKAGGERESVALYSWRREGEGDNQDWKWWKHSCAGTVPSTVPSFPF